uniref:BED-type domain-containing protein n=1 Tax=Romanomermis culicivorax TaxID=13658 RepID=A0A915IJJ1_ROMCU
MPKQSIIWQHFDPLPGDKAKCLYCKKDFMVKNSSTKGLWDHLSSKHSAAFAKAKKEDLSIKKAEIEASEQKSKIYQAVSQEITCIVEPDDEGNILISKYLISGFFNPDPDPENRGLSTLTLTRGEILPPYDHCVLFLFNSRFKDTKYYPLLSKVNEFGNLIRVKYFNNFDFHRFLRL